LPFHRVLVMIALRPGVIGPIRPVGGDHDELDHRRRAVAPETTTALLLAQFMRMGGIEFGLGRNVCAAASDVLLVTAG